MMRMMAIHWARMEKLSSLSYRYLLHELCQGRHRTARLTRPEKSRGTLASRLQSRAHVLKIGSRMLVDQTTR